MKKNMYLCTFLITIHGWRMCNKTKNHRIQILRAFAIIAVVMIHTSPPAAGQVIFRPFINFGVATFLFLSGYLTKIDNNDWMGFYKKRIIRVFIPYVIWTTIYCILRKYWTPQEFLYRFLTAKAAAPLYYIFVYFQFVLLTPFLGKLAKSRFQWVGWLIAPIAVLVFKYYWLITGTKVPHLMSLFWDVSCLGWFIYYYLGLMLGNGIIKKNFVFTKLFYLYAVSIVINMVESYWWLKMGETNCGTQLKLSSFVTSTIFVLIAYTYIRSDKYSIDNSFVRMIGDYSFGIYLCHIMFMMFLSHVPYYKDLPFLINSSIVLLVSLGFVYIGHRVLGPKFSRWLGLV